MSSKSEDKDDLTYSERLLIFVMLVLLYNNEHPDCPLYIEDLIECDPTKSIDLCPIVYKVEKPLDFPNDVLF